MSFRVVILSARASNLIPCVESLMQNEPDLASDRVIVVDDGARAEAESRLPGLTWVSGETPFVFARNANTGIRAAGNDDVILLNDDACLRTPQGLTRLAEEVAGHPNLGICSPGIQGAVGNPRQKARGHHGLRPEQETLVFVCVYLTRRLIDSIGDLDERFVGYGFEDNDYCLRARHAGFGLGIWEGCVVDHHGGLPSTYRSRHGHRALFEQNRRLYQQKWPAIRPAGTSRSNTPPGSAAGTPGSTVTPRRRRSRRRSLRRL